MSPSTFRQHFRALAGVSPLQYQKRLRLQEARQLMLNESLDAGSAGGRVGYESPSQFSREYSRCSARRLSAMSRACGWLPLPPPHLFAPARGPQRAAPFHAIARRDRRPYLGELGRLPGLARSLR
jgi:hypothetical protein